MKRITFPIVCFAAVCIVFLSIAYLISTPDARVFLASRDFRNLYTGATLIKDGETVRFYDADAQYRTQRSFVPEMQRKEQLMPFNRPPVVALLLSPLAALPFTDAFRIATAVNFLLLLGCVVLAMKIADQGEKNGRTSYRYYVPLLFACWLPVWITLLHGQFSFMLFLVFGGMWYFMRRGDERAAGLTAAALIAYPQLTFIPLAYFFFTKRYKTVVWFAGGLGILTLASGMIIGFKGLLGYPGFLMFLSRAGETYTMHPRDEATILSLLHTLFNTDVATPSITVVWITVSVFLGSMLVKKSGAVTQDFIALIVIVILTSAHTNYHDLTLLLLALMLYLTTIPVPKKRYVAMIALPAVLVTASAILYWYPNVFPVAAAGVYFLRGRFLGKNLRLKSR